MPSMTAQDTIKRDPKNIAAHKLLGRIYLHSLGDMQNGASQQVLDRAINEYKQISALDPTDIQSHLVLGQLYTVNHDSQLAQQEFEAAQKIDPNSEDVALNLARLYGESGDIRKAIDTLKAVPEDDRSQSWLSRWAQAMTRSRTRRMLSLPTSRRSIWIRTTWTPSALSPRRS